VADERLYFGNRIPFLARIGVHPGKMSPDQVSAKLDSSASLANGGGYMHGGSLMSALDFAMSAVARGVGHSARRICTKRLASGLYRKIIAIPVPPSPRQHRRRAETSIAFSCRTTLPRHRRPTISRRDFVP